jgi:molybdopterin/thiamine biosynthesis adenylyltransferase
MSAETRSGRQTRIFGSKSLARLQRSPAAVIGVGLLGGALCPHLGLLEVPLFLIDPDTVSAANLANQGFPADRMNAAKVVVRAEQLKGQSPRLRVRWHQARIEDVGLGQLAGVELIITGLDSRVSRARVAEISQKLGRPWLDLACDGSGESLQGTVTYWDPRVANAGCHLCRYDADQIQKIRREGRGPGCPSWASAEAPDTPPTLMASAFGAVIAGFGASWAVQSLLGQGDAIANKQLQIFGDRPPRIREIALQRSSHCALPHVCLGKLVKVAAGTVAELFARATLDLGAEPDSLRLHHRHFVSELYCPTEGRSFEFARLAESIHPSELECGCAQGARRVPFSLADRLVPKDVERFGGRTWKAVGLPHADVISASAGSSEVHYVVGGATAKSTRGGSHG